MRVQFLPPPSRVTMNNVSLKFCIEQAYSMTEYQVFGPAWINSERYDISASLAPGDPPDNVWPAFRILLDERFHLTLHREEKVMPVYALVIASGGPKLTPAKDQGAPRDNPQFAEGSSGTLNMDRISMKQFCNVLTRRTDRHVVDATGIAGEFEIVLSYQSRDRSNLSLFTALQRQLRLKLESRKELIDTLTVQNKKRPSL